MCKISGSNRSRSIPSLSSSRVTLELAMIKTVLRRSMSFVKLVASFHSDYVILLVLRMSAKTEPLRDEDMASGRDDNDTMTLRKFLLWRKKSMLLWNFNRQGVRRWRGEKGRNEYWIQDLYTGCWTKKKGNTETSCRQFTLRLLQKVIAICSHSNLFIASWGTNKMNCGVRTDHT